MTTRLLYLLLWAPFFANAQDDCLCCKKQQSGQAAYDKGDYKTALDQWQRGLQITDAAAKCPDLKKLIWKARDSDGDGVVNGRDRCDEVAGPASNGGCPLPKPKDRDEDGVLDGEDDCPDTYGPRRFKGCPDTDGDELPNHQDKCPEVFGPKRTNGCPDRDGDGVADKDDKCPDVAGLSTYKGCPKPAEPAVVDPPRTEPAAVPSWLAYIKGGTFDMGDTFGDGSSNETVHKVTVSDFYMSKYEVSFDDFDAFCAATRREKPADSGWGRGKRPVINVDWYDAVEYCNWRSQQDGLTPCYSIDKTNKDPNNSNSGDTKKWTVTVNWNAKGYRLPTEAEWEYAAREGGKKVRFGNGRDVIDPVQVNFDARSNYKKSYSTVGEYRQKTVLVDELSANAFGLKNMSGNVLEWCWDWYGAKYYAESEGARNPRGSLSGQYRCLRGGSWLSSPVGCRSAFRGGRYPNVGDYNVGFRVVRPL